MKVTAVIMAGGRGERFWPKSRGNYPKQFLSLTKDGETMIQKTVKRLLPMVAMEDVFVVTNVSYAALVKEQLPQLPGGEHPAGAVCQKYSTLYRSGCRCDPQEVRRGNDAGAAPQTTSSAMKRCTWTPCARQWLWQKRTESGDHRHYPHLSGDRLWLYQL